MAYLRELERKCQRCGSTAKVELISTRNDPMGVYCRICGQKALKLRLADEAHQLEVFTRRSQAHTS